MSETKELTLADVQAHSGKKVRGSLFGAQEQGLIGCHEWTGSLPRRAR